MKVFCWFLALALCSAQAAEKKSHPSKRPVEEKKIPAQAGGISSLVLPQEGPSGEDDEPPLETGQPKAAEIPKAAEHVVEVPKQFLPAYFEARPKDYLVDPQKLLGSKDYQERLDFLKYHAGDSAIDFYIYLFGREQEIPGEARAGEMVERLFSSGRPAVVVFYFLGAPQRSEIHLSPKLTEGIPAAEQRRALQSSVMVAFEKLDFASQLDAFAVQMSIRIYWMERMLGGADAKDSAAGPVKKAAAEKPHALDHVKAIAIGYYEKWRNLAALAGGLLVAFSALVIWLRLRGGRRFPDLEVEPRLGGAHCAGVGAVISFASSSVPPASQKDQVPDYLRRA